MKVHHITEAPRIEPKIGGIGTRTAPSGPKLSSGSGPSLPKSVDIKAGILDPKGNKIFNVVDQNGKVLKRFTGPSAEADANTHRDNLKKQIKAAKPVKISSQPKLTGDPKADLKADPKPDADSQKPKAKFKMGWKTFGAFGAIISAGLLGQEIIESSGEYAEAIDRHNGDTSHPDVQKARQYLANVCADAVVQLFLSIASGALAGSIATRALVGIPGAGWIAAILAGGATTIVSYAASKAAKGEAFIDSIARWMMRNIDDDLLRNLTDDVSAGSEKAQAKDAMKDLILNDPKMMQAFKKAKATKAAA
jgi:hypothetical protein